MNIFQSLKIKTFSIKLQLILMIALGIFLPILLLIVFSGIKFKTLAETAAKNKSFAAAQQYSNKIQGNLNSLFSSVNNLAITYESLIKLKKSSWLSVNEIHEISEKFLSSNPTVVSVYTILSPGRIDSSKTNRNSNLIFLGNDNIDGKITEYDNWDYQFKSSVEDTLEKGKGFMLLPPYVDNTIGSKPMLIISYGKRLDIDNRFSGLVGIDISINWIQEFISGIDLFNKKAHITIVSNTGIINGDNKDNSLIGKNIREALKSFTIESKHLMSGSESELKYNGNYIFYVPIKFDNLGEPWHIRILVPEQEILNDANKELYIRILYFVIVTFLILFVSYFYFNRLSGRISTLAASAKLVAKGNLSVEIKSVGNDELTALGDSLQSIVTRFSNILNGIKNSLDQLKISTEELSKTSDTLHEGASGQASSTEQVSAAMEQMVANIEQNTENARTADTIAKKAFKEIENSSKNVRNTANSMGEIAKKITIINEIAFQVNILALNAEVEAARAGIHGKGFGVVAAEVGNLADRTKLASQEIDELTSKGFSIAKQSGIALELIVPEIKKTATLVQEIASASIEQKAGTEQINQAIQQLNSITQLNANSAEHLASRADNLSKLAEKLSKLVSFFKLENKENHSGKDKLSKIKASDQKIKSILDERKKIEKKMPESIVKEEKDQKIEQFKENKGINLNLEDDLNLDKGFEKF